MRSWVFCHVEDVVVLGDPYFFSGLSLLSWDTSDSASCRLRWFEWSVCSKIFHSVYHALSEWRENYPCLFIWLADRLTGCACDWFIYNLMQWTFFHKPIRWAYLRCSGIVYSTMSTCKQRWCTCNSFTLDKKIIIPCSVLCAALFLVCSKCPEVIPDIDLSLAPWYDFLVTVAQGASNSLDAS